MKGDVRRITTLSRAWSQSNKKTTSGSSGVSRHLWSPSSAGPLLGSIVIAMLTGCGTSASGTGGTGGNQLGGCVIEGDCLAGKTCLSGTCVAKQLQTDAGGSSTADTVGSSDAAVDSSDGVFDSGPVAEDTFVASDPCKVSASCKSSGHCTTKVSAASGDACYAATDADCAQSTDCTLLGKCSAVDGKCSAASDADCSKHDTCSFHGQCKAVDGKCIAATDADCKPATVCTVLEKCKASGGVCVGCAATCAGKPCGSDNGCGTPCGCGEGEACVTGQCRKACEVVDSTGCCDGAVVVFCESNTSKSIACSKGKNTNCGWNAANSYYDCVDTTTGADPSGKSPIACKDVCLPKCGGKACGAPDGCGGVCGCSGSDICLAGKCSPKPDCSVACSWHGRCTVGASGDCIAGSASDCANSSFAGFNKFSSSQNLSGFHPVKVHDGHCRLVADAKLGCDAPCKFYGHCTLKDGLCFPTQAGCLKASTCKTVGWCQFAAGECLAQSASDCVKGLTGCGDSNGCSACDYYGRCTYAAGFCLSSTDIDCKKAFVCKWQGDCSKGTISCEATTASDCKASQVCSTEGACSLKGAGCAPGSDADCKQSQNCTDKALCKLGKDAAGSPVCVK